MHRDRNTYLTALHFLEQHGDTAPIRAAERADRLSDAGDLDRAATWRRVLNAIKELRGEKPAGTVH